MLRKLTGRLLRRKGSLTPAQAYRALYGPHTATGNVLVTRPIHATILSSWER